MSAAVDRGPVRTLLATEAALTVVTLAAVVGMHRLFADGSYRPSLLLQAVVAHVVVAVLRRVRTPLVLSAVVTAVAAVLALTWNHYAGLTAVLLPTPDVASAAGDDLRAAWQMFQDVKAPAPVDTGFLLAGGAAVWAMVFVADWAAFRAAATFEALLPSATLFLFAAALGAPGGRVAGAAVYAATAMAFVLLQRTLTQEQSAAWAATHRTRGRWSLIGTGAALIGVAVVLGAVAGPNLPGAHAEPLLAWRDLRDEDDTRVVISPMIDIQGRLLDQPDVELFTVRSPQPAYWRMTSLDRFDGEIWRSSYGTNEADGELPQAVSPGDVATTSIDQTVSVSRLAQVWLPAAFEPMSIDASGGDVSWDSRSSTLIVSGELEDSDDLTYQVTSQVPTWSGDQLASATGTAPDDIRATYLGLPDDLDGRVVDLARQVTAGEDTPYGKALALATYLRSSEFTYFLEAPAGHSNDALVDFLFTTKRGYCEQFAGAFGAMARAIDLPTRVAVGFTSGIRDPSDPNLYRVTGRHAHAWDEVYLDDYGWVTFDPTPGRAPPQADQWLGVPPAQDETGNPTGAPPAPAPEQPVPAPAPNPAGGDGLDQTGPDPDRNEVAAGDTSDGGGRGSTITSALRTVALALLALVVAYAVIVPLVLAARAALRRRRASAPGAHVQWAWRDTVERARVAGADVAPSLTVDETARALAGSLPEVAPAIGLLAGAVEQVVYAEVEPRGDELDAVELARHDVAAAATRRTGRARRTARAFDVRRLWRTTAPRRSVHVGPSVAAPLTGPTGPASLPR
jgi:transglutaminase-like putative cysteine protease